MQKYVWAIWVGAVGCAVPNAPATDGTDGFAREADVTTRPNATCALFPASDPGDQLDIFVDDTGVARLQLLPAAAGDDAMMTLACTDATGWRERYAIDRGAAETFAATASPLVGAVRPALTGDPLSYSRDELFAAGYGWRPDPQTEPELYQRWLDMTSRPAHQVEPVVRDTGRSFVTYASSLSWGGTVIYPPGRECFGRLCFPSDNYQSETSWFNVPTAPVAANTYVAVWGGLGGYVSGDTLLAQDGVTLYANAAGTAWDSYGWIEFAGAGTGPGYATGSYVINASPGDYLFTQAYACDASGNITVTGGYACFFIDNMSQDHFVTCNLPTSACPSLKVEQGNFVGWSTEVIAEKDTLDSSKGIPHFSTLQTLLDTTDKNGAAVNYSNTASTSIDLSMSDGIHTLLFGTVTGGGVDHAQITWNQANY